jgi:type I restriction enzyme S subunit
MALRCNPNIYRLHLAVLVPAIVSNLTSKASGIIPGISRDTILKELVPIPPFAEQKRIYGTVKDLVDLINQIDKKRDLLEETISIVKAKILDLAIRGKLVPQDPADEPASVLLERIRADKEEQIKAGKIKRDKKESFIFRGEDNSYYEIVDSRKTCLDEDLPFEIPQSWQWVRLGTLFQHNTGKALNSSDNNGERLEYITTSNVYWNRFELQELKRMPFSESELEKCSIRKGDLLVCEGGDIGRAAIWEFDEPMMIQNHIHRLRPYIEVSPLFYLYVLYRYKQIGLIGGNGIGIQGLSSNAIHQLIIPLPPIAEQKRIISAVRSLFAPIERIQNAL